jgi:hypothetical protein
VFVNLEQLCALLSSRTRWICLSSNYRRFVFPSWYLGYGFFSGLLPRDQHYTAYRAGLFYRQAVERVRYAGALTGQCCCYSVCGLSNASGNTQGLLICDRLTQPLDQFFIDVGFGFDQNGFVVLFTVHCSDADFGLEILRLRRKST